MSAAPDANLMEARRWLLQAEQKFAAATATGAARQWPEACFWFQQAAELALKALMICRGERARVHGLLHLVERLTPHYPEVAALSGAARRLDRFYIPTRYPDSLPRGTSADYFVEKDFTDARTDAMQTLDFSRQRLLQP